MGLYVDCDPVSVWKFPLACLNSSSVKQAAEKKGFFLVNVMPDVFPAHGQSSIINSSAYYLDYQNSSLY